MDLGVFISYQNHHNGLDSICLLLYMAFEQIPSKFLSCFNSDFGN